MHSLRSSFQPGRQALAVAVAAAAFSASASAAGTAKPSATPPPPARNAPAAVKPDAAKAEARARTAAPPTVTERTAPRVVNAIWADKAAPGSKTAPAVKVVSRPAATPATPQPAAKPAAPKPVTVAAKPAVPGAPAVKPAVPAEAAPAVPAKPAAQRPAAAPTNPVVVAAAKPATPAPAAAKPASAPAKLVRVTEVPAASSPRPEPRAAAAAKSPSPADQWARVAAQRVAADAAEAKPAVQAAAEAAMAQVGRAPAPARGAAPPPPARAAMQPIRRVMTLRIGESQVLDFDRVTRAAVGNEAIADIAVLSGNQILVNGRASGVTTLLVWDRRGQNTFEITVVPEVQNVPALAGAIRRDINNPNITVRGVGSAIFLEGTVNSAAERDRAEAIATAYYSNIRNLIRVELPAPMITPPPPGRTAEDVARDLTQAMGDGQIKVRVLNPNAVIVEGPVTVAQAERARKIIEAVGAGFPVLELLQVGAVPARQVLVKMRVIEVNRVKAKDVGFDWNRFFRFAEDRPTPIPLDAFGPIRRFTNVEAILRTFERDGVIRTLAEPNLLVQEGEEGSILLGGEVPIPVSQGGAVAGAITVEYKEFGVRLGLKPTAIAGDLITLGVAPEVSTLDPTNAVRIPGSEFEIPGFRTRRASSVVTVRANQTLAIGGLLQNDVSVNVNRVPVLGRLPIIGELFKSKNFQRNETELVILITPQVLGPGEAGDISVPDIKMGRPLQDPNNIRDTPKVK